MPEGKEDEGKRRDRMSKHELMEKVQEFCVSDAFEKEFESFAKEHSDTFLQALQFDEDSTEHPLEFHNVYRDYLRRFEGLIEDFISTTGFTINEFFEECKYILDTDDLYGSKRFFIETMLATSEYENFFILMKAEMRLHANANRK